MVSAWSWSFESAGGAGVGVEFAVESRLDDGPDDGDRDNGVQERLSSESLGGGGGGSLDMVVYVFRDPLGFGVGGVVGLRCGSVGRRHLSCNATPCGTRLVF